MALDFTAITTAITDALPVSTIATILGAVVAAAATPMLMWFGGRKIVNAVKGAITKGKLTV